MIGKETINKTKYITLFILIILEITSLFLMYKSLSDKETKIDNVTLNKEKVLSKDMFAIMLNNGSGTYTESNEKNFSNLNGYVFNSSKSGCIDIKGNKLEDIPTYNSSTKKVTVTTGRTSYCYLYFDKS